MIFVKFTKLIENYFQNLQKCVHKLFSNLVYRDITIINYYIRGKLLACEIVELSKQEK